MDKHIYFDLKYDDGAEWKRRKLEDIFIHSVASTAKNNIHLTHPGGRK